MAKRAIPTVPRPADPARVAFDATVKENLEILMGRRGSLIEALGSGASTAQIIAKINEIIDRLQ